MSQSQPVRVNSGIPWWLWGMLIFATVVVVVGVVFTSIPEDPEQLFESAKEMLETRQIESLPVTINSLKKFPDYADHVTLLDGMHAANQGRYPRALEYYEKIRNPDLKSTVLQKTGDARARVADFPGAIKAYEEAISEFPEKAKESRMLLANLYFNVGATKLSEDILTEVLESEPGHREALNTRAQIKLDLRRYDEALEDLNKVLVTPGDFAAASPALIQGYLQSLMITGDKTKLSELYKAHLEIVEDTEVKARILLELGEIEALRAACSDAAAGGQAPPDMKASSVFVSLADDDLDGARIAFREAVRVMPRGIYLFEAAVKLFEASKEPEKLAAAEENLKQLRELDEEYVQALRDISENVVDAEGRAKVARIALQLGRFDAGRKWFSVAEMLEPGKMEEGHAAMDELSQNYVPLVPLPTDDPKKSEAEIKDGDAVTKENEAEEVAPSTETGKIDESKKSTPPGEDDTKAPGDDTKAPGNNKKTATEESATPPNSTESPGDKQDESAS